MRHPHLPEPQWLLLSGLSVLIMGVLITTCAALKVHAQSPPPPIIVAPTVSSQPAVVIPPSGMPVYVHPSPGAGQPVTIITPGSMPTYVWPGGE